MKLKEYIEKLNALAEKFPESLEWELVYSSDDEGNQFNTVHYDPSHGFYDPDQRSFSNSKDNLDDPESAEQVICIN